MSTKHLLAAVAACAALTGMSASAVSQGINQSPVCQITYTAARRIHANAHTGGARCRRTNHILGLRILVVAERNSGISRHSLLPRNRRRNRTRTLRKRDVPLTSGGRVGPI